MGGPSFGWIAAFDELLGAVRASSLKSVQTPVLLLSDPAAPASQRTEDAGLCRALPRCTLMAADPDLWPERETAFATGVATADANPLESDTLPLLGHGR